MTDGGGGREVGGVQRVGYEFEGHGTIGQGRRLVDEFFAVGVFDPEFALVCADAIDGTLMQLAAFAVAGLIDREFDGRRTAVQDQDR